MTLAILMIMAAAALGAWKPEYFTIHRRKINDREKMNRYRDFFDINED